jgi:hypothetical protein
MTLLLRTVDDQRVDFFRKNNNTFPSQYTQVKKKKKDQRVGGIDDE